MEIPLRSYEAIPAGVYLARIAEIETQEGKFGPQLRFRFLLDDEDATTLTAWTSTALSQKSKLYGLVRAAFGGRDLPAGFRLQTDQLIGRRLQLVVDCLPRPDGGGDFNKVEKYLPLQPPKAAMAKPAAQPAAQPAANGNGHGSAAATPDEPPDLWPDEAPGWLLSEAGDDSVPF